jgi:uncharacterized repeat protein (TIGR03803 family)
VNPSGLYTNSDGSSPAAALTISNSTVYGTTSYGGIGYGTVFKVNSDGSAFTNLHVFNGTTGKSPVCRLLLAGKMLYGTTVDLSLGNGTVFAIGIDGKGFTNLHFFNDDDGSAPYGGLVLSNGRLYGTTKYGGIPGRGTVFSVNVDGSGFTNLHSFNGSEGANPAAGLVLLGNLLYGTTFTGGSWAAGTIFAIRTDGTGLTTLYNFTGDSDGAGPQCDLVLLGNTFYGTASGRGDFEAGTMFALNSDGSYFRTLHSFTRTSYDGGWPDSGLTSLGNSLYGVAFSGGSGGNGTVFTINTDSTDFAILHSFSPLYPPNSAYSTNADGSNPFGALAVAGDHLYGTASNGGMFGGGVVFSISLKPSLAMAPSGGNLVLSWPTNFSGLNLQSTTKLFYPVWTTNLPAPVVVNGQYTVTNPISGTQQFFRLSQ